MSVSFATDIKPTFQKYQEPMTWRFDLTDYNAVKENATLIQGYITSHPPLMPPPDSGYPPLSKDFLKTYDEWVKAGCPA